jgi:hypothetical protein
MADFVYNISKGRVAELYNRVDSNDPTNSALVLAVFDMGATTDATLRDLDTLQAVIDDANSTERTTNGWTRKTLTDADIVAFAADDTNDRVDLDIPDQTWTAVSSGASTDVVICYDSDTTGGTDTNIVPLTQHDFAITPDGSDVVMQVATAGFFRAS